MKIAIDSNDLPAETRLNAWRGMLCDTYIGMDCEFPGDHFRSVIEGYAFGDHSISRFTSSRHFVDRSRTLIKRDGLEIVFLGVLLAGRLTYIQDSRETTLEPGAVVLSDTSRPFQTGIHEGTDIVWIGVPKQPIVDRVRGLEDMTAIAFRPERPVKQIVTSLMAGFDALSDDVPAHKAERLTTHMLDLVSMTIVSSVLPSRPPR